MNIVIHPTLLIAFLLFATNPLIHAASEANYVAIYLGPTHLTSAHGFRDGNPVKIAQVLANQAWQDWALKRPVADPRRQSVNLQDEWDYDPDLLTMFLPTLQQIAQATTAKLQRPYEIYFMVLSHPAGMTGRNTMVHLIRNSTDPSSVHFADPPLPAINTLDRDPFIRVGPMAMMAYNLTTPEAWGARPNDLKDWPGDGFKDDDDFALLVNFEPKYLELAFECSDWACDHPVRALYIDLGEEALFHGLTDWNVTSEEWNKIINTLSRKMCTFVEENTPGPQYGKLRIVTFFGGVSLMGNDAMQIALTLAFPKLEAWRLKTDLDPAFVPSLGAALQARNVVESNRRGELDQLYPMAGLAELALFGTQPTCALQGCCNWFDYYRDLEV